MFAKVKIKIRMNNSIFVLLALNFYLHHHFSFPLFILLLMLKHQTVRCARQLREKRRRRDRKKKGFFKISLLRLYYACERTTRLRCIERRKTFHGGSATLERTGRQERVIKRRIPVGNFVSIIQNKGNTQTVMAYQQLDTRNNSSVIDDYRK
jgi:hypothetical protein